MNMQDHVFITFLVRLSSAGYIPLERQNVPVRLLEGPKSHALRDGDLSVRATDPRISGGGRGNARPGTKIMQLEEYHHIHCLISYSFANVAIQHLFGRLLNTLASFTSHSSLLQFFLFTHTLSTSTYKSPYLLAPPSPFCKIQILLIATHVRNT